MYHSVSAARDPYTIAPETFQRHIRLIRDAYRIIALPEMFSRPEGSNERQIVITFDDAFVDFEQHVYPVLSALGVPATVFVPTGHIGLSSSWDRESRETSPKPIMSKSQLRAMSADPHIELGSHTIDHVCMRQLTTSEMREQLLGSRRYLEDLSGRKVTCFSYPFGQRCDFSSDSESVVQEAGYQLAVTTCWGTRNSLRNRFRLRRIWLKETDDDPTVRAKIDGAYDWIGAKESVAHAIRSWTGRSIQRPDHRSAATGQYVRD